MPKSMIRVGQDITPEEYAAWHEKAQRLGLSVQALVKAAVAAYEGEK